MVNVMGYARQIVLEKRRPGGNCKIIFIQKAVIEEALNNADAVEFGYGELESSRTERRIGNKMNNYQKKMAKTIRTSAYFHENGCWG